MGRCDTICDLPDYLLTQILLNLPTKDSVRTSVLSTRWRNLWLSVPGIYLTTTKQFGGVKGFEKFIDRFMESNHASHLQHFKVVQDNHYFDRNNELLSTVIDRGIQHLDFTMYIVHRYVFMHQNIYKSKTLVSLMLFNVELKNPEFVVSLPCLKIIKLSSVFHGKDGPLIVEKIISGSPVLEDLRLIRPFTVLGENVVLFLRVKSQSLKKCCFGFGISIRDTDFTVEIDAPRLEYLSLSYTQSDRIVVKNLSSLLLIDIDTKVNSPLQADDLRKRDIFYDLFTKISSVKHMIICRSTLEVLYSYSKLKPIPKLHNLYHLQTQFPSSFLPPFLETCRNLKALTLLDYYIRVKPEEIDFTSLPRCLISTLEYVEIKKWMIDEDGIKLVNYFLENSPVLKKLTLSFRLSTKQDVESYKKFLTSTKLSPICKLIIGGDAMMMNT